MAKTIAVSDEVYELLKKSKMPGESFSTVIKRGLSRKGKISEIAGTRTIGIDGWKAAKLYLEKAQRKTNRELTRR